MRMATVGALVLAVLPLWAATAAGPVVVRSGEFEATSLGVGAVEALTPSSSAALAQFRLVEHPGYRTPLHIHDATDESFYVIEGSLTLYLDGEAVTLQPGDYAFIPRGTPHAQGNRTEAPVVSLTTLVPGAFAQFFAARAELVKTIPPDHPDYGDRMRALGKDHDIRIVGPAPF